MRNNQVFLQDKVTKEIHSTFYPETYSSDQWTKLTQAEGKRLMKEQIRKNLAKWLKPGDTVYCNINSVSRSGMSRNISLYAIRPAKRGEKAQLADITYAASEIMGWTLSEGGLKVSGCGMDMCFHTVYNLGRSLWPNGTKKPHGKRNGEPDTDGGYALKHSTL